MIRMACQSKKKLKDRLRRKVTVGALQSALKRLKDKSYLLSKEGESTSERGGRPKRYFNITALGKRAIEDARETRNELYSTIPKVALDLNIVQ